MIKLVLEVPGFLLPVLQCSHIILVDLETAQTQGLAGALGGRGGPGRSGCPELRGAAWGLERRSRQPGAAKCPGT